MATPVQVQIRRSQEELREAIDDLYRWEETVKKTDSKLKEAATVVPHKQMPPVRGTSSTAVSFGRTPGDESVPTSARAQAAGSAPGGRRRKRRRAAGAGPKPKAKKKLGAYDYAAWDKLDVDAELAALDAEYEYYSDDGRSQPLKGAGTASSAVAAGARAAAAAGAGAGARADAARAGPSGAAPRAHAAPDVIASVTHAGRAGTLNQLKANDIKDEGNRAFEAQDYPRAIELYTEAMRLDRSNAVYVANRAQAYLKQGEWARTVADASEAISLDPLFYKAYARRAAAYEAQGRLDAALADFEHLVRQRPSVAEWRAGRDRVAAALASGPAASHANASARADAPVKVAGSSASKAAASATGSAAARVEPAAGATRPIGARRVVIEEITDELEAAAATESRPAPESRPTPPSAGARASPAAAATTPVPASEASKPAAQQRRPVENDPDDDNVQHVFVLCHGSARPPKPFPEPPASKASAAGSESESDGSDSSNSPRLKRPSKPSASAATAVAAAAPNTAAAVAAAVAAAPIAAIASSAPAASPVAFSGAVAPSAIASSPENARASHSPAAALSARATSSPASATTSAGVRTPGPPSPAPRTFIEFQRQWSRVATKSAAAAALARQLEPANYVDVFKTQLEDEVMVGVLTTLASQASTTSEADFALDSAVAFTRVPRFSVIAGFLSAGQKLEVRAALDAIGTLCSRPAQAAALATLYGVAH